ncbi:MAG TPA: plastocyanin/azurin family copper-binding protein, partial [Thermoleophilaceae bacterium]|nr:plastocyanin/azurin family copper-binding protein [Thermoleophilaceae bacterium]
TFDEAGTFEYICTPHPNMQGTVVVEAASSGDTGDTGTQDDSDTGAAGTGSTGSSAETDGSSDDPGLPATGADAAALAILGLLMLALGGVTCRACPPARSASSSPSPAWTGTTAGRRSSPGRCATPAWR